MKLWSIPAALLLISIAVRTACGDSMPPASIVTVGNAEVRVIPDFADLSFTVEVRHADLATARTEQANRAAKVLAALHAAGINDKDLQTSQVGVSTHYARSEHDDTATVSYYNVSQSITCTLRDVKKVGDVTTNVLLAGASEVGGAILRTSDLRRYRDEARVQAARAAREKAVALATELGAKVGKPYSIVERPDLDNLSQNNVQQSARGGGTGDDEVPQTTFAPGMISVSSSVQVTFLLD